MGLAACLKTAARLESRSYDLVVLCYSLKPEEM